MFIDVLHHTEDPLKLLREALRVARKGIIIKDHMVKGFLAWPTLRAVDWVGNAPYGVVLPYNYLSEDEWQSAFKTLGLKVGFFRTDATLPKARLPVCSGTTTTMIRQCIAPIRAMMSRSRSDMQMRRSASSTVMKKSPVSPRPTPFITWGPARCTVLPEMLENADILCQG